MQNQKEVYVNKLRIVKVLTVFCIGRNQLKEGAIHTIGKLTYLEGGDELLDD